MVTEIVQSCPPSHPLRNPVLALVALTLKVRISFRFSKFLSHHVHLLDANDDEGAPLDEPAEVLRNEEDKDDIIHEAQCLLHKFNQASTQIAQLRVQTDSV
jgi:hypothetical protein